MRAWQQRLLKKIDHSLKDIACFSASVIPRSDFRLGSTLIVRPGGMGDLICAHMALEALGLNPLDFDWLIERRCLAWALYHRFRAYCYDDIRRFPSRGFETVINLEQLYGLSQAFALACRGRGGKLLCFETNRSANWADVTVTYDPDASHEVFEFGRIFAQLKDVPPLRENPVRQRKYPAMDRPAIGIAGRQEASRSFSLEDWTVFAKAWLRKGERPFIIAEPSDELFAEELAQRVGGEIVSGDFGRVCETLAATSRILTVDGGMCHIASYYGVPSTVIFTSGRWQKWAPLALGSEIVRRRDLPCSPCVLFGTRPPCPNNLACKDLGHCFGTR